MNEIPCYQWCQFETNIDIDLLAVRVLKVRGTQVANSNRSQCSRHGAAALGARMSLLDRFARVVKVRVTTLLCTFFFFCDGFIDIPSFHKLLPMQSYLLLDLSFCVLMLVICKCNH